MDIDPNTLPLIVAVPLIGVFFTFVVRYIAFMEKEHPVIDTETLDPSTGLVQLPPRYYWRVRDEDHHGLVVVSLKYKDWSGRRTVFTLNPYGHEVEWSTLTSERLRRYVKQAAISYNKTARPDTPAKLARANIRKYTGNYPPKRLKVNPIKDQ